MRHPLLAPVGFFMAALLAPHIALASGNVLLPSASSSGSSSTGSSASLPNLGLIAPTPTPSAPAPQQALSATLPTTPAINPTQQTPVPATAAIASPITAEAAKNMPLGTMPTQVVHMPDASAAIAQSAQNFPNTLALTLSNKSVFGAKDVQTIQTKLGLGRNDIASSCALTVQGLVMTDKGTGIINGGLSPQIQVHYNGTIKSFMMMAQAACTVRGKLPPTSGFLIESGGHYLIPLQPISCPAPSGKPSGVVITYDGSGTSQCTYQ